MATATQQALRVVGAVEAFKGVTVLLTATGLLALVHRDLNAFAERLVRHAHLNPASELPHIFLDAVARVDEPRLLWLAFGAAAYGVLRLLEAYGLFLGRAWAEWLGALSGGLYVPFEIVELVRDPSLLTFALLIVNLGIVAIMVWALMARRAQRARGEST